MIFGFISVILSIVSLLKWPPCCILAIIACILAIIEMAIWSMNAEGGIVTFGWIWTIISTIFAIVTLVNWLSPEVEETMAFIQLMLNF